MFMDKNTSKNRQQNVTNEDTPSLRSMNVSSATELTGMMYHPPITQEELDSYQDLYKMEYSDVDEDEF